MDPVIFNIEIDDSPALEKSRCLAHRQKARLRRNTRVPKIDVADE